LGALGLSTPLLSVRDLRVGFESDAGVVIAVDGVSFDLSKGETLAIVGESGCGKTVTAHALLRLLPAPVARVLGGRVSFDGVDLLGLDDACMRSIRGRRIAMVFQEPMTALNPVFTVGEQVAEGLRIHERLGRKEAMARAIEMMGRVGIPAPAERARAYPHQLSGGLRQRVMIAMALACRPDVLIADEPTTALDVTLQMQILHLLRHLQQELGLALLLITHDLGVVAEVADRVLVLYAGEVVESAPVRALFASPRHPYTAGLLASIPQATGERTARLPAIAGMVPSPRDWPAGCRFAERCARAAADCRASPPPWTLSGDAQGHRCIHPIATSAAPAVEKSVW
jgi:oligopeptide/dipeptide ABC transporter ATP-binding protein